MSETRRQRRLDHIETLRQQLNLMDWEVRLSDEPAEEGFQADIHWRDAERVAQIRMDPNLPESMDLGVLTHEMVHLAMHDLSELGQRLLVFVTDDQARTTFAELLEDALERAVEAVGQALTPGPRFVAYGEELTNRFPAFAARRLN